MMLYAVEGVSLNTEFDGCDVRSVQYSACGRDGRSAVEGWVLFVFEVGRGATYIAALVVWFTRVGW